MKVVMIDDDSLFSTPFVATSLHELTNYTCEMHTTPLCNSYSTELITAKVYKILDKTFSYYELMKKRR